MTTSDAELLRRFGVERSEPAFTELVGRHLDLVHSAALRQMDGDASAAEDITQAVFTDLARKAARLSSHTSLTGWLYTSTRYLAANARRDEHRRRRRDQEAHAMNQLLQPAGPAPDWDQLRPVLDEAMHELGEADRDAVLSRFFERRPLAEVGERLGLGENAARMRVDRALDKLRRALARRGVTSTAAALMLALTGQAVAAAPAGLAPRVSRSAIAGTAAGAAAGGGLLLTLIALMTRTQIKLLVGTAALALFLTPFAWRQFGPGRGDSRTERAPESSARPVERAAPFAAAVATEVADVSASAVADDASLGRLHLTLLTADTGRPVPNVLIERGWVTDAKFLSQRDGTVSVTYPKTTKELRLTTRADGFADTCLRWNLERGEVVPATYTLKLERSVPIGGTVVDADGKPVVDAKVGFNPEMEPDASGSTESHDFGWIEVATDEAGRWQINRVAENMIRRLYGSARHPDHVDAAMVFVRQDAKAEKTLRAGKHVFQLGRAVTITGLVVDTAGDPVAGAKVSVGRVGMSGRREGMSEADGSFRVSGCPPGKQLLSAQAKGYAARTEEVTLAGDSAPFRLVLRDGKALRLRVVAQNGQPVPKAYVWLNTLDQGEIILGKPASVQVEVELRTDSEGRVVWDEAPETELSFDIHAPGHMRVSGYKVRPDGQEHTVTLPPALTIFGSVRDAKSGEPVPKFRIIAGWPQVNFQTGATNPAWSPIDRFWLGFGGGAYRHTFEEPVIGGIKDPGYVFKFEAEGYTSFVSRTFSAEEGEVRLDVTLRTGATTTVTVLTPAGRPAANAEVALVSLGGQVRMSGAGFERHNHVGCVLTATDRDGRFQLPADESILRVIAAHAAGFIEAAPQQSDGGRATLSLLPWGRIEGKWVSGDKPAVGREVLLQTLEGANGTLQFDFQTARTQTDADGRFSYERVPPGKMQLTRLIRSEQGDGRTSWGHGSSTEVEVLAGEATAVTFGAVGYQVTARLAEPEGKASARRWRFFGTVHTPMPAPPEEIKDDPAALARWWRAPERQPLAKAMKRFAMSPQPDGTLSVEEVEPGSYAVSLGAFVAGPEGQTAAQATAKTIMITVPAEPATGVIDLGVVTLEPVPPPR